MNARDLMPTPEQLRELRRLERAEFKRAQRDHRQRCVRDVAAREVARDVDEPREVGDE